MSFITRIAARSGPAHNTLAPKGFARRAAAPADQAEQALPLRRQAILCQQMHSPIPQQYNEVVLGRIT